MRPTVLRILVALAALIAGVSIGAVHRRAPMQPRVAVVPIATPEADQTSQTTEEASYRDELGTNPYHIAAFLAKNPQTNLEKLWQRLKIPSDAPDAASNFNGASYYETHISEYCLSGVGKPAIVLQIRAQLKEAYRYLIFKGPTFDEEPTLLGYADVRSKYPPSDPVVLVSNGRAYLILQSNIGTGTGFGAWLDTVYEVTSSRLRPVGSYVSRSVQRGPGPSPSKELFGRPTSCEIEGQHAILMVSYTVEYSYDVPLFEKQQKVVFIGSLQDGSTRLDAAHSDIPRYEFDSIYNDWTNDAQFLSYNHSELRAIALGNNTKKKQWLRDYLAYCEGSAIKRELLRLLNRSTDSRNQ